MFLIKATKNTVNSQGCATGVAAGRRAVGRAARRARAVRRDAARLPARPAAPVGGRGDRVQPPQVCCLVD